MKVKLEIVSGFLESGKTSFINSYLISESCYKEDILVILLERGNCNIREDLSNIKVVYLEEVEKLKEVIIKELRNKIYYKIIIEFNGTSNLKLISNLLSCKELKRKMNFYGLYFVGNSVTLMSYIKNLGEILIPYIKSSKLIILNNISLLKEKEINNLITNIEDINPIAPIILSKRINLLENEIRESKYFKDNKVIKKIKNFLILRRGQ